MMIARILRDFALIAYLIVIPVEIIELLQIDKSLIRILESE